MKQKLGIDRIAFIGRTLEEYRDIFMLDEELLRRGPVLDCPAGAASFAAEAHRLGIDVTACDILYGHPIDELASKGEKDIVHIYEEVGKASGLFRWEYYKSRDELIAFRRQALELFLVDFPEGFETGRYTHARLPSLPFPEGAFRLVISSHFLFLYGDMLDTDFHKASLSELARVASEEVRIFPLNGLDARPYPHMDEILAYLCRKGINAEIVEAPFEFQIGANKMLRLRKEG